MVGVRVSCAAPYAVDAALMVQARWSCMVACWAPEWTAAEAARRAMQLARAAECARAVEPEEEPVVVAHEGLAHDVDEAEEQG